ncbi:MAG TPA: hypothetical protein VF916_07695, partial [Ktedonobacterales bacterium]
GDQMACYVGVPGEVAEDCERIYTISKSVRLEALRRIQDRLAPYGQFKQWCLDHEENYGSVQYALSQAYGVVGKRTIKENSIAGLLSAPADGPPRTEEQTIIQAQAERVRVLEAQVKAFEQRSASDWAAAAKREEEADEQALRALYSAQFLRERPFGDADRAWSEGLEADTLATVQRLTVDIYGLQGSSAHQLLHVAEWLLCVQHDGRWRERDGAPVQDFPAALRRVAATWLSDRGLPVAQGSLRTAVAYWERMMACATEYGLNAAEARTAFRQHCRGVHRSVQEQEVIAVMTHERAAAIGEREMDVWADLARKDGQEWAQPRDDDA